MCQAARAARSRRPSFIGSSTKLRATSSRRISRIDTLSRAFAGNEIDRVQVYAFAMHMQKLAMVAGGSVTVLSHPSLQGISSGSGISGSTAWHGAFRFRQYLKGIKPSDGEQPDSDLRELEFKKNQYGPTGETIVLRYQRGLFLPEGGISNLDQAAREQKAEEIFLALLARYDREGRNVSDKQTAHNYAPSQFCKESEAKGIRKQQLEVAMRRLFQAKRIHLESYGRPSRPASRLKAGPPRGSVTAETPSESAGVQACHPAGGIRGVAATL